MNPNYPLIHFFLAEAYEQIEKPRDAREEYRAYLMGAAPLEFAQEARERVMRLNGVIKETGLLTATPARSVLGSDVSGHQPW